MALQKKIALLGIPTDLGAPDGVLTIKAPETLRDGFTRMFEFLGIEPHDLGDIVCPSRRDKARLANPGTRDDLKYTDAIAGVAQTTRDMVRDAVFDNEFAICMGGDHSTSFGTGSGALAGLQKKYGAEAKLGCVTVDAHPDMHTHETSVSRNAHGTSTAAMLGFGDPRLVLQDGPAVEPRNLIHIASREIDNAEEAFAARNGIQLFTMRFIREHGLGPVFKAIDEMRSRVHGVWINIDVDGLDPSSGLVATGMFAPHGLPPASVIDLFTHLRDGKDAETAPLVGMEIAEFVPANDPAHITRNLLTEVAAMSLGGDFSPYAQAGSVAPATAEVRAPSRQIQQALIDAEARLEALIQGLEEDMKFISRAYIERKLCGAVLINDIVSSLVDQTLRHKGNLKEWVCAQDSIRRTGEIFAENILYDFLPERCREAYADAKNNPYTSSNSPFPEQANRLRLLELKIAALEDLIAFPRFWGNDPEFQKRKSTGLVGKIVFGISDTITWLSEKMDLGLTPNPSSRLGQLDPTY